MTTEAGAQLFADGVVGNTFPRLEFIRAQVAAGNDMGAWGEVVRLYDAVVQQLTITVEHFADELAAVRQEATTDTARIDALETALAELTARVDDLEGP